MPHAGADLVRAGVPVAVRVFGSVPNGNGFRVPEMPVAPTAHHPSPGTAGPTTEEDP